MKAHTPSQNADPLTNTLNPTSSQRPQYALIKEYTITIILGILLWFKEYSLIKGYCSLWVDGPEYSDP